VTELTARNGHLEESLSCPDFLTRQQKFPYFAPLEWQISPTRLTEGDLWVLNFKKEKFCLEDFHKPKNFVLVCRSVQLDENFLMQGL